MPNARCVDARLVFAVLLASGCSSIYFVPTDSAPAVLASAAAGRPAAVSARRADGTEVKLRTDSIAGPATDLSVAPLPGTVAVVPKHPGRYAGVVNMVAGGLSLALGGILIGATSQCHGELCWLPGLITGGLFVGAGGGGLTAGLVLVAASGRSQEASTIYLATHAPTQLDAGEHARAMRKARRGAIVSGVAALAGLALAGGGAGLWKAWDNIIHNDAKPYPTDEEKVEAGRLWPAGTALVTIGLATFLPSFIAMSVELARYRTLKRVGAGRGATLSARPPTPWVTRDGGGVAVAGSF